jgi:hypothetical protein
MSFEAALDRTPVIVAHFAPVRGVRREHATTAVARQLQPGIAHRAHRAVESDRRDLIAPGIDGSDAMPRACVDDLQEITLLADRRGIQ